MSKNWQINQCVTMAYNNRAGRRSNTRPSSFLPCEFQSVPTPRNRPADLDLSTFLATLVAHNAGFDIAFLDAELKQAAKPPIAAERMVDTLVLARRKHPGGHNTLDDLCSQDFILQNAEVGLMTATKERVMKALMVITSHDQLGDTGRKTGFWLEELSTRPFALTASSRKTSTPSSTRAAMARCGISPKTSTPSS